MSRRVLLLSFAGLVAALGAFVAGMRSKSPLLQDRVRQFSKRYVTPNVLHSSGGPGQANGVVHHRGRTSGRDYATPVTPTPIPGGFLIALPYTSRVDWARNVLAAGEATIVHDGASHRVVDPVVVPYGEVAELLPRSARIGAKVFSMEEFLRVRTSA